MANKITLQMYAIAKAIKQLFEKNIYGPKVEEVAEEAHGGLWPVGYEDFEFVVRHAPRIRQILQDEFDLSVYLVNKRYYTKFRRRMPGTVELAKDVLPGRGEFRPAGFHLVTTENDTIYLASEEKSGKVGIGVIDKVKQNISRGVEKQLLSSRDGKDFVKSLKAQL